MPQQEHGRMRGFQLWINLPASDKMKPPAYRDLRPEEIPTVELPEGGSVRVITGELQVGDRTVAGPVRGITTQPIYFDVVLPAGATFSQDIAPGHHAFVYVYEGTALVGEGGAAREVRAAMAAVLGKGDRIEVRGGAAGGRFLLLAARPIGEPIVQYGPFVMNTQAEIRQAIADYQAGRFEAAAPMQ
jgi:redox-sensitive bicupin YhaK (pirin superfamily)